MLVISNIIFSKNKKKTIVNTLAVCITCGIIVLIFHDKYFEIVSKIYANGFDDSHRFTLWQMGYDAFTKTPYTVIFGSGIVTEIDSANRVIVYHSSLFETLASSGLIGFTGLIWFSIVRLKLYLKLENYIKYILFASWIALIAYGLIDNTIHMYYFMIPLSIHLATLEKYIEV